MKIYSIIPLLFVFLPQFGFAKIDTNLIDSIVLESADHHSFEGTVLIAERGEIAYHKSFGFKDAGKTLPMQKNSRFGIASITKMITAMVILQLVEEQKLLLSNNLETLLPSLEIPEAEKITVHHLLLHISGLPNEDDQIYFHPITPVEYVTKTITGYEELQNFEQFNYANIDFVLLGLIIESIEGKSWQEVVRKRVIGKLNLLNTGFLRKDEYPSDFAYSFSFDASGKRKSDPEIHIENFYAAGCMFSTAEDLLKIDQAMYGQVLLTDESKELMFTSYPEYNYTGYSVWTYNDPFIDSQPRIMERRGGIFGSNSVLIRMLDSNKTIIILSNNSRFNPDSFGDPNNLREALIRVISS